MFMNFKQSAVLSILLGNMHAFTFIIFSFGLCSCYSLSYDDIVALNASCAPADTCSVRRTLEDDNLSLQTCECRFSCARYGTCCIDSPHKLPHNLNQGFSETSLLGETCELLMGTQITLFAKTKCRQAWQGDPEIKSSCEKNIHSLKDPVSALPVTNAKTHVTYGNYFCALCNDDTDNLVFWNIVVVERSPALTGNKNRREKDKLLQDLTYDEATNKWGVMDNIESQTGLLETKQGSTESEPNQESVFQPVYLTFDYPSYLRGSITLCDADVVSECHPDWKDKDVEHKCYSYMGLIRSLTTSEGNRSIKRFRNVHCAICNFADVKAHLICKYMFIMKEGAHRKPFLSFSLLLDINPSDGDRVGEISQCPSSEIFDPFFKKCRVMRCMKPGYKLRNQKCVPS